MIEKPKRRPRNRVQEIRALQQQLETVEIWNDLDREKFPPDQRAKTIAERVGVDVSTVHRYLRKAKIAWQEKIVDLIDEQRARALKDLAWVREQARAEWERSKKPAQMSVIEQGLTNEQLGDGTIKNVLAPTATVKTTTKGQCGAAQYLETIRGTWQDVAKLLGLNAPTNGKIDLKGNGVTHGVLLAPVPLEATAWADIARAQQAAMMEHAGESASSGG